MGRRALRRTDPFLDLSQHLKAADELPEVWSSASLFGNCAPLELEVGSGKGLFLLTASESRRQHNFIGLEISRKYARFAAARLARAGRLNAKVVRGDAVELVHSRVPADSIESVHVYFPDPWWKKRHKKRRIMNERFLWDIQRVLVCGGRFHLWTDVEEYFRTTLELVARVTSLRGPTIVPQPPAYHDRDYRTHFERRMRMHDVAVYRAEYCK